MNERQMQFRVGLFVICALAITGAMAFQFGELRMFWESYYTVSFEFETAEGIHPASPVRKNGILLFDEVLPHVLGSITTYIRKYCHMHYTIITST